MNVPIYYIEETYTVKPVLRGHLREKQKVIFYDRLPLKRGSIHINFSDRTRKMRPFYTVDRLIEVTPWVGLTVAYLYMLYHVPLDVKWNN